MARMKAAARQISPKNRSRKRIIDYPAAPRRTPRRDYPAPRRHSTIVAAAGRPAPDAGPLCPPRLEGYGPVPVGSGLGPIEGPSVGVIMSAKRSGPPRPTFTEQEALQFHSVGRPGKLEVIATKPMATQRDLSLAYSP